MLRVFARNFNKFIICVLLSLLFSATTLSAPEDGSFVGYTLGQTYEGKQVDNPYWNGWGMKYFYVDFKESLDRAEVTSLMVTPKTNLIYNIERIVLFKSADAASEYSGKNSVYLKSKYSDEYSAGYYGPQFKFQNRFEFSLSIFKNQALRNGFWKDNLSEKMHPRKPKVTKEIRDLIETMPADTISFDDMEELQKYEEARKAILFSKVIFSLTHAEGNPQRDAYEALRKAELQQALAEELVNDQDVIKLD